MYQTAAVNFFYTHTFPVEISGYIEHQPDTMTPTARSSKSQQHLAAYDVPIRAIASSAPQVAPQPERYYIEQCWSNP